MECLLYMGELTGSSLSFSTSRLVLTGCLAIGIVHNMRKNAGQNSAVHGLVTNSRGHTFWRIDETSKVCTPSCSLVTHF